MSYMHLGNDFSGNKVWKIAIQTEQNYSCCRSVCREQKEFSLGKNLYYYVCSDALVQGEAAVYLFFFRFYFLFTLPFCQCMAS